MEGSSRSTYTLSESPKPVSTKNYKETYSDIEHTHVLVYGGNGALGSRCILFLKDRECWVASIDFNENCNADCNILVKKTDDFATQEYKIKNQIHYALGANKLDGIICVAGGWIGGNANKDLVKNIDLMWKKSVWPSLIASVLAMKYLYSGGLLVLSGAQSALQPTPGMIGYGMAKAAVHQLVASLGHEGSGLPKDVTVVGILPLTLDTPMNRKWMTNGDDGESTSLDSVAKLIKKWIDRQDRPRSGSLCQIITKGFKTEVVTVTNKNAFVKSE